MAFSDEQKLIVALLTEIHEKLGIQDGLDAPFVQSIVSSDNTWALRWRYQGMFKDSETPPNVKRVADVLDMCEVLERTADSLSDEERAQVEAVTGHSVSGARFVGYSGNDEDEFHIVQILVDDLGKWGSFKGRDFNAHMPMVDVYDRMLNVYSGLNSLHNYSATLSVEDLTAVLDARTHPDHR
ncbi:hypothetical protein EC919_104196 [Pseudomonas graminis]|uniref:YfbU family protein n=1 Tax=Pseudomonas graminis TaxID=158627 RepID=UPI00105D4273|nr:YfbU family protein [Pseudomonas graminis]TDV54460.1 hypothetical protein EC919_104196 [Pseudomonas graminis]